METFNIYLGAVVTVSTPLIVLFVWLLYVVLTSKFRTWFCVQMSVLLLVCHSASVTAAIFYWESVYQA